MSGGGTPPPVVLVTGASRRGGAEIVRTLHRAGCRVAIHYRSSGDEAAALAAELERARPGSASTHRADLMEVGSLEPLVREVVERHGRLDGLVNNASLFFPTSPREATPEQWEQLLGANARAPYFLCQAAAPHLAATGGAIVNLVDVHGERPMKGHALYSISKAAIAMLTLAMAKELGPAVRVNGVAPGAILWPESEMSDEQRAEILDRIALARKGEPEDIAGAVRYLLLEARYVTGQILAVDGGRSLNL